MEALNTTGLVESIRTVGQIPSFGDWTDAKILELATEQLRMVVAPLLVSHQESYFVDRKSYPLVSGQSIYRIPSDAMGGKIVGLYYQPNTAQQPTPLTQTAEDRLEGWSLSGSPEAYFFLDSSNVRVVPTPSSATGSLIFKFNRRPPDLVAVDSTRVITSVLSIGSGVYEFSLPATLTIGQSYDFVKGSPNFDNMLAGGVVSAGGTLAYKATFSKGGPEVGDGVFALGQSHFVPVPPEYFYYLAEVTASKYLRSVGQLEEVKLHVPMQEATKSGLTPAASPRSDESPKKFKNRRFFGGG